MRMAGWLSCLKLGYLISVFLNLQGILGTKVTHQIDLTVSKNVDVSQAAAKAGPHGNLISPKSGKLIRSVGGLGTIAVKFVKYKGNDGETIAIDVRLRPISDDENRTTYVVVLNFFLFPSRKRLDLWKERQLHRSSVQLPMGLWRLQLSTD
ncbi:hypothetical protein PSTG_12779 [Puccinia striiformis f. sp. tritici PST-78]|uniref:Uncharacterized protein n=1 Tax=Puccinia striiformis f. sp. tritici PST-78 TaxID=1165861 RepID=A0A0L0V3K9_9BASI|nr:hypothetical protein PSTG_12779 [Puccinia striiformis f. sp. tritici PST-78]